MVIFHSYVAVYQRVYRYIYIYRDLLGTFSPKLIFSTIQHFSHIIHHKITHHHMHVYIYIYIYTFKDKAREREREKKEREK